MIIITNILQYNYSILLNYHFIFIQILLYIIIYRKGLKNSSHIIITETKWK